MPDSQDYRGADAAGLARTLRSGAATTEHLVAEFNRAVEDLDRSGPALRSVIQTAPQATEPPSAATGGDWAGIPVLLKDNIDVAAGWCGTAGSLALATSRPGADAPLVSRLRAAGLVPVGAANMSEWANFRSTRSTSGWSGRGGLTRNPHALDRSAGGSSSGSAAAVAAGLVPWAVGTETDGSIVNPASRCGVVGIKPTVGLVPGDGVVPISHAQDTAGPLARTVSDAAALLEMLSGKSFPVTPVAGLRVGLLRRKFWARHPGLESLMDAVTAALAAAGAGLTEEVDLPGAAELAESGAERVRLLVDFRRDLAGYLASRIGPGPRSLAEIMSFNSSHAEEELPYFGQELLAASAETEGLSAREIAAATATCLRCGREEGIDAALRPGLDCLIVPAYDPAPKVDLVNGDSGSWLAPRPSAVQIAAVAGYPALSVPMGDIGGLPVGLTVLGTARSEATLIAVAAAVESALSARLTPGFRPAAVG